MRATRSACAACVAVVAAVAGLASCNTDYFNRENYQEIVAKQFPIDTIDARHDWKLMQEGYVSLTANVEGVASVQLLSANPYESDQAEILAEEEVAEGQTVGLNYATHSFLTTIYAAALSANGRYLSLAAVSTSQGSADFSRPIDTSSGRLVAPTEQTVYYCFEGTYPVPDDWDYNDVVLRISRSTGQQSNQLRLTVTLEAAGTTMQMAAAIRLYGVNYDQVESVTTENNATFVKNTDVARVFIKESDLLLKGRNNEAVINLFDDAHLAFYSKTTSLGMVNRWIFNTSRQTGNQYANFSSPTVTYVITFKDAESVRSFRMTDLDPFVLTEYNSAIWEVHKYDFKLSEVLKEYYGKNPNNYNDGFAWALEIPYTWFRYPLEGETMGTFKGGLAWGAYQRDGHSFGLWLHDHNQATDWYLYPTSYLVY